MTTFTSGGKISAHVALTMQAGSALTFGDPIKITGDYLCDKADSSHAAIGYVITPNVARGTGSLAGTYPQSQVPGDVAVEVRGFGVGVVVAGSGGVTAGDAIKVVAGAYVTGTNAQDVSFVGWALTTAAAAANFDILWA